MRQNMTMHQPSTHIILGDFNTPASPSCSCFGNTTRRVPVEERSIAFRGDESVREVFFLVGCGVVSAVSGADVPVVGAMGVEGVEVPAACWAGVGEPDYVKGFADVGGEGVVVVVGVPAFVVDCGGVVGDCA